MLRMITATLALLLISGCTQCKEASTPKPIIVKTKCARYAMLSDLNITIGTPKKVSYKLNDDNTTLKDFKEEELISVVRDAYVFKSYLILALKESKYYKEKVIKHNKECSYE